MKNYAYSVETQKGRLGAMGRNCMKADSVSAMPLGKSSGTPAAWRHSDL